MSSITLHISEDDADEIEAVADLLDTDKNAVISDAICEGLAALRRDQAIERYQTGDVSVNQAARIADLSLADWLVVAREHGLTTQLTPVDLDADADAAEQL
jgi:predicted HTH domain antitoxin